MSDTLRLTMAQALMKYLAAQQVEVDDKIYPLFAGVFAIFGHGNVAGVGEALWHLQDQLPTYRGHNEQGMAHAAIAFAKAHNRRRIMVCTASAGPGSTNMVTAAALAHVNRLPVLFLPGDTFASRIPDPVLQQTEVFADSTVTTNDCFKPVSRFFDRITRPEQLLSSLPQALRILTDPADCGPVTLALPQDVQTMAFDYPRSFFEPRLHYQRRQGADQQELERAIALIRQANKPLLIAGGGLHYSGALPELEKFVSTYHLPVGETQAGKGALPWDHPCNMGSIGVTGALSTNTLASEADLILAVGTRMGDFTSGSRALINPDAQIISLNVTAFDAIKHKGQPLVGDAKRVLAELLIRLSGWQPALGWISQAKQLKIQWDSLVTQATSDSGLDLPSDAQVIGALNRAADERDIVVCAAGGLPGELHKLWRTRFDKGYHVEYGFSCMGYEIAGGLGVKMAKPDSEVFVILGDGSYLMLNSEIATSVMLGQKLIIVVLDNRGFACINRLQQSCGGAEFNNMLANCVSTEKGAPKIDFAAHAAALGARAENVSSIKELEAALERAKASQITYLIALDTNAVTVTSTGGAWWEVAVPEVSQRTQVVAARQQYETNKERQQKNL